MRDITPAVSNRARDGGQVISMNVGLKRNGRDGMASAMSGPGRHKVTRRRSGPAKQLGRPPGSSAEETVARLVEAAQVHFGTHGYSGARMTEIAAAAGITHSSTYQYFASKRELYQAAFHAALAELLPEYMDAIRIDGPLREKIKAIFLASARTHERKPTITPFLASIPIEIRRHPDLVPSLQEGAELLTALIEMFSHARQHGEIPTEANDMDLIMAFLGSAMGIGLLSHGLPESKMGAAVDILLAAFDGELFKD